MPDSKTALRDAAARDAASRLMTIIDARLAASSSSIEKLELMPTEMLAFFMRALNDRTEPLDEGILIEYRGDA